MASPHWKCPLRRERGERIGAEFPISEIAAASRRWGPSFEQKLASLPLTGQRHYLYFQRFPAAAVHSSWFNFRQRYIDHTGSGYVFRLAAESGGDDLLPIVSIASRALNVHLATFEPENRELRGYGGAIGVPHRGPRDVPTLRRESNRLQRRPAVHHTLHHSFIRGGTR